MTPFDIRSELNREIDLLAPHQQERLLRTIHRRGPSKLPKGTSWEDIEEFAGSISHEDAELMRQAIEEGCEQIEPNSW